MKSRTLFCRGVSMNAASMCQATDASSNEQMSILSAARRIFVRIRRHWRQFVAFRLQLFLDLLDPAIELLIFALKFFRRIVVDHDIGIDAVTFNDPFLSVLRVKRELRFEKIAAVNQRKRIANSNHAAPRAFSN